MFSLSYKRLHSEKDSIENIVNYFDENLYTDEKGMGYHKLERSENHYIAYYIYTYPSSINVYNELKEDFEQITIQMQDHIPFCIDIENELLVCLCAKSKVARLVDVISASTQYSYTIENVEINMEHLLTDLKKQQLSYEVRKVRINEIENQNGDICDIIYRTLSKRTEAEVFEKYKKKIYQYTICIDEDLSFNVFKTGTIRIIRNIDSISIDDIRIFINSLV